MSPAWSPCPHRRLGRLRSTSGSRRPATRSLRTSRTTRRPRNSAAARGARVACRWPPPRRSRPPGPRSATRSPPAASHTAWRPMQGAPATFGHEPARTHPGRRNGRPDVHSQHVKEDHQEQDLQPELGSRWTPRRAQREERGAGNLRAEDDVQVEPEAGDLPRRRRSGRTPRRSRPRRARLVGSSAWVRPFPPRGWPPSRTPRRSGPRTAPRTRSR